MADYMTMFDSEYIGAWDLNGRDVVVTISRVQGMTITGEGGKKNKKPVIWFEGKEKGAIVNKTNAKAIAGMYGRDTAQWIGKRITLYPTQTQVGSETKECIRVRPTPPTEPTRGKKESVDVAAE
jgi:hypothetical protein